MFLYSSENFILPLFFPIYIHSSRLRFPVSYVVQDLPNTHLAETRAQSAQCVSHCDTFSNFFFCLFVCSEFDLTLLLLFTWKIKKKLKKIKKIKKIKMKKCSTLNLLTWGHS